METEFSYLLHMAKVCLVDLVAETSSSIWESESFSCQMASLVKWNNYGFGIHGQAGGKSDLSKFFCVDLETGKERWSKKGFDWEQLF